LYQNERLVLDCTPRHRQAQIRGDAPISNGFIQAVGTDIVPGSDAEIIDVQGRTVLPGFFNTHVHRAFKADVLRAWAHD
jgi:cytosine/adenosine deaminase-related metal-dependent hydrolase